MTIKDLIEELEQMAEFCGEDTEVRLATQPSWPFEYSIGAVAAVNLNDDDEDGVERDGDEEEYVVYIGEGRQLAYLPGIASQELGWR